MRWAIDLKAEQEIQDELGTADISTLHLICAVHKASAVAKKAEALEQDVITFAIRVALLLRGSGMMNRLKKAIVRIFETHLFRHVGGSAGVDAAEYRKLVVGTFLSNAEPRTARLKSLVVQVLNGDFRSDQIDHYCHGCCRTRDDTLRLCRRIASGLAGRAIRVFPRTNWCGADKCLDSLGIVAAMHNLLARAMSMVFFFAALETGRLDGSVGDEAADVDVEDLGEPPTGGAGTEGPNAALDLAVPDAHEAERKENAANRQFASNFLKSHLAVQRLVLARTHLRPQSGLMLRFLQVSGSSWERRQLKRCQETGRRDYRITFMHACADSFRLLREAFGALFTPWGPVPFATVETAAQSFRVLSRAGGTCYKLVICKHRWFPYLTFRVLQDPAFATTLASMSTCLMDAWSERLVRKADGDEDLEAEEKCERRAQYLQSAPVAARLKGIAAQAHTDTVSTERAHAGNSRRTASKLRTHAMGLVELSAFQALKSTRPRILKLPEKATPTRRRRRRQLQLGDVVDEGQHGQPKKRTYSRVGSWRAFVSYHSRSSSRRAQTKWDPERLQELSEAYRALSEEELGFFRDLAVMMSAEPGEATPKRCRYTASQLRLRAAAAERIAICDAPAHMLATVAPPWQSNSIWETAELQRKLARDAVREALISER